MLLESLNIPLIYFFFKKLKPKLMCSTDWYKMISKNNTKKDKIMKDKKWSETIKENSIDLDI